MIKMTLIALLAGLTMANSNAESPAPVAVVDKADSENDGTTQIEDTVTFKGDIRIRGEQIEKDGSDTRDRARVRARIQADAKISDEVNATIGIVSGSDDPVSSNQTFGDGASNKDLQLDQAVLNISPEALSGVKIQLGKMKTPFIRVNSLVFDGDLRPEGASLSYNVGGDVKFVINGGAFWIEERSEDDETMLYGAQAAVETKACGIKFQTGASLYYYEDIEGFAPVYDTEDSFGNSTVDVIDPESGDVTGIVYANGFEIIELFVKAELKAGNIPVSLNGSHVMNEDADEDDKGYQAGIKLGKRKDSGSFDFGYTYRELEANAVLGAFTDSDAYGGGTDGKSHIIKAGYQISKKLSGHISYFSGEAGLDSGTDYDRIQIDLVGKF